jgi:hypothetical protein
MCTHHKEWVYDRLNRVQIALNTGTPVIVGDQEQPGKLARFDVSFPMSGGQDKAQTLSVTFILWSPMTAVWKTQLPEDSPGADPERSFPYRRASLNNTLKTQLMNDCLADAVVYSGVNGDAIRTQMQQVVCASLGGKWTAGKPCDFAGSPLPRPLAIVTESLGSKFLFDAVRAIWANASEGSDQQAALAERLATIDVVYLLANQLPILDTAGTVPGTTQGRLPLTAPAADGTSAPSSLGEFLGILKQARSKVSRTSVPPPTVVAFTDPNDLLSYRLLPNMVGTPTATLINVMVSNDVTYFNWLEDPLTAHCGYAWNPNVISLVALGYQAGRPIPSVPKLPSNQCF